ncbi:hypothetical protein Nizo1840_1112 [Lactiplantibacillus plantarum]|nr:hypothetical protein Nizo1840_1112 [Lactiplantibacillus plantarum]
MAIRFVTLTNPQHRHENLVNNTSNETYDKNWLQSYQPM